MAVLNSAMSNTRVWTDAIWAGELAEIAVHRLLTERGVEHHWNNGLLDEAARNHGADFYVSGVAVGVKCAALRRRVSPDTYVLVPAQHARRTTETCFIFCAYERADTERMVVLGAKGRRSFFASATSAGVGDRLGALVVKNPCYGLRVDSLVGMTEWLEAARSAQKPL